MSGIPKPIGKFETTLASKIIATDTSMVLATGVDGAGNALSGLIGFTIDEGTVNEEFVIGTATGANVASLLRGISPTDGKTEVALLKKIHRRGATVKVTDFPLLGVIWNVFNGTDTIPAGMKFTTHPTFTEDTQVVDKKYADDIALQGAPNAAATAKGVTKLTVAPVVDTNPLAVGDNDPRMWNVEASGEMKLTGRSIGFGMQTLTGDGSDTIDWRLGNRMSFTFGAANQVFAFVAPTNPGSLTLILKQDSVGSRTVTWPAAVKWQDGVVPTLTTTANAVDIASFIYNGTNYFGSLSNNFS